MIKKSGRIEVAPHRKWAEQLIALYWATEVSRGKGATKRSHFRTHFVKKRCYLVYITTLKPVGNKNGAKSVLQQSVLYIGIPYGRTLTLQRQNLDNKVHLFNEYCQHLNSFRFKYCDIFKKFNVFLLYFLW